MIAPALTVGDAMLRRPTLHPADLTVAEARSVFAASPKTHLLLLVADGVLVAAVDRDDLTAADGAATPAARVGSLRGRTVGIGVPLEEAHAAMLRDGSRRLAVVDPDLRMLGLLCLKRSLAGFCTDEGVAAMRAARAEVGAG